MGLTLASFANLPLASAQFFSTPTSLPNADPYDNVFPKIVELQNGTVWMVWEKVFPTTAGEIYLASNNGFGWGGQTAIVSSDYDDIAPSMAQLNNGTVILAWSRGTVGNWSSYDIFTRSYTNNKWSNATRLGLVSGPNFDPVMVTALDGTVWLVWTRWLSTNGQGDLYYATFKNGRWSTTASIIGTAATSSYEEKLPTITQTADGKIWVCYESNIHGLAQIYCTSHNGINWSASQELTFTTKVDKWPSVAQSRNGSLWVFFAREQPNGTTPPPNPIPQYQWDIYYKMSANNGTSWSVDTALYSNVTTDEQHPAVFQGPDKKLWIVFDSCCNSVGNPYGTPNLFIVKSEVILAHDLAVGSVTLSPSPNPRRGENETFKVKVSDTGDYSETSALSFYVNSTLVGTQTVTLTAGGSQSYSFVWKSAGHIIASYPYKASIAQVSRELVTQNNSLNSTFLLTFRGDVDRDGEVTIVDLATVAVHFGSSVGGPNYYAAADLDNNGVIDIVDLTACAADFGNSVL